MAIEDELRYYQNLDVANKQIIESLQIENYNYKNKTWVLENTVRSLKVENDNIKRALRNEHEARLALASQLKQVEELIGLLQGDAGISRQELYNLLKKARAKMISV